MTATAATGAASAKATAIVAVKRFSGAKRRLVGEIGKQQRAALLKAMLQDTVVGLGAVAAIDRIILVTAEGRAERQVMEHVRRQPKKERKPFEVLQDPDEAGHDQAATLGIIRALSHGAGTVVLLPGDTPLLDSAELDAALRRAGNGRVGVVPDHHGTGTNALILTPADAIRPGFGPGSCERHLQRARDRGLEAVTERLPSLALDCDTAADLLAMHAILADDPARAPHTAAVLAEIVPGLPGG